MADPLPSRPEATIARASVKAHGIPGVASGLDAAFGGAAAPLLSVADRYGHRSAIVYVAFAPSDLAGLGAATAQEAVLAVAASRVRDVLRGSDLLARSGATAFTLLLSHLWEPGGCYAVVQRLAERLARPYEVRGEAHDLRPSVGVAVRPDDGSSLTELLELAMAAAADAGAEGSAYRFTDPAMAAELTRKEEMHRSLATDAPRSQFLVDYQPIFSLATDEVVGVESLIRWNHPTLGLIPAGAFVPEAERTGRIRSLDRWIVRRAMEQTAEWQESGWNGWVSVNLSGQTISDTRTLRHLRQALESASQEGSRGVVEITESAALSNPVETTRFLDQVRELGVYVAVDDFGTGYSSLEYISLFDADMIKLDRSFLEDVEHEPRKRKLLEGFLHMARHMGKPVVAEGVETEAQQDILAEAGCEMAQGFFCARPMPPADFEEQFLVA